MENAIWTTIYDLPDKGLDEYLNWFHDVHIPEILSRKGYLWAAHYQIMPNKTRMNLRRSDGPAFPVDRGYAILFGGESTRTFLDPSPTQLKDRYTAQTSEMIARRIRPVTYIHTVEWRIRNPEAEWKNSEGTPASFIQMGCFDASGHDEELGEWFSQERMDMWIRVPGSVGGRKLLATVGPQRHGVLYDFTSLESHRQNFPPLTVTEWTSRILTYLLHPLGSSFLGRRIWPPA